MIPPEVIALFVKPPVPGRVKTRLGQSIGHETACRIYVRMVELILAQIKQARLPLALCYDGDDPAAIPQPWREHAAMIRPQHGATLGERMAKTFTGLFVGGVQRVLLMGSDIPGIDAAYLLNASEQLQYNQMVIAPAVDGGYGLIGLHSASYRPQLFRNIPWSSDQVCALTLNHCEVAGIAPVLLPLVRDVDTVEDLRHYPAIFTEGELALCPKP